MHASNFRSHISSVDLESLYQTIHSFTLFFIILVFLCCGALLAIIIALIKISLSKQHEKESVEYASHIITAQEEERSRLSAELHDTVAQDLCVALSISDNEKQREILHNSIEQIRSLCYALVPPPLAKTQLSSILHNLCLKFIDDTKIEVNFFIKKEAEALLNSPNFSNNQKLNVYRIIQESLQNVKKHAQASEVSIFARRESKGESEGIYISIEDDGKGFSEKTAALKEKKRHFGLQGMKQRALLLGGTLNINSKTSDYDMESGTEIILFIPVGAFEK
ncbi:MAG: sensor histidine kinase [Treponema sp.]|nr:sensor histidine kinase [Treponema sp.]